MSTLYLAYGPLAYDYLVKNAPVDDSAHFRAVSGGAQESVVEAVKETLTDYLWDVLGTSQIVTLACWDVHIYVDARAVTAYDLIHLRERFSKVHVVHEPDGEEYVFYTIYREEDDLAD